MDPRSQGRGLWASVTGIGAATCLGPWITAAAAARAGLVRFGPVAGHVVYDDESGEFVPLDGAPALPTTEGFEGVARVIRLALAAIDDLKATTQEPIDWANTGIFVALSPPPPSPPEPPEPVGESGEEDEPEPPPPTPEQFSRSVTDLIIEHLDLDRRLVRRVFHNERTGTLNAIHDAMQAFAQRQLAHALILAADSAIDERKLARWAEEHRVKTPSYPVGFIPGEAAVAMLLSARGPRSAAVLHAPIIDHERLEPDTPPAGRALSEVLVAAAARSASPPSTLYVDLNGEVPRAMDFGCAIARTPAGSPLRQAIYEIPATSFGETGAASPLLAIALGIRAFARGYAGGTTSLIVSAADDGLRAAFALERDRS